MKKYCIIDTLVSSLQFLLSGSDDFNLYMWKIPDEPLEGMLGVFVWHRTLPVQLHCVHLLYTLIHAYHQSLGT